MEPRARPRKNIRELGNMEEKKKKPGRNKSKQYYEHGERFIVHSIAEILWGHVKLMKRLAHTNCWVKSIRYYYCILMCSLQTAACNARSSHARRAHATSIHISASSLIWIRRWEPTDPISILVLRAAHWESVVHPTYRIFGKWIIIFCGPCQILS